MPTKRPISTLSVFLSKTDGRDALIKIFQFTALTVSFFALQFGAEDIAIRAGIMMAVSRDARRILRLFRGIIEYNKLMEISGFIGQSFYHNSMILTRIFFILWMYIISYCRFFDNIAFLTEKQTISTDPRPLNKLACIFWTAELIAEGSNKASQLYLDSKSKVFHKLRLPTLSLDAEISHNLLKQKKLVSLIYESIWKIVAITLNLFASISCTTFLDSAFGWQLNDGIIGITSLNAAFIEAYQVYNGALTDNLT